jgi:hypothetical protein
MNTESSYTHPTYPCQKWLQSRKGKGDNSMWEEGAKGGNYLPPLRQGKTCMVKAKLLKAWSQGFIGNGGVRVVVKPSRFVASYHASMNSNSVKPACSPSGRSMDRTGHLIMSTLRAIELQDCLNRLSDLVREPAWQRSGHITQGWPVMGSADRHWSLYRHGHKLAAMRTKTPLSGWKGRSLTGARNRKGGYADAT